MTVVQVRTLSVSADRQLSLRELVSIVAEAQRAGFKIDSEVQITTVRGYSDMRESSPDRVTLVVREKK